MINQSDIKRRIESVKQTRQITGAMETVSVAKMRKASELCDNNRAYFDILCSVMNEIVAHGDESVAEFSRPPKSGKPLVIVVASDKGLCGSFNHDIFKTADGIIDGSATVLTIGRTALDRYKGKIDTIDSFTSYASGFDYSKAAELGKFVLERYGVDFSSVSVVYSYMKNQSVWEQRVLKLLPIPVDESDGANGKYVIEFEPSKAAVFEKLLPLYVGGTMYGALVHSAAAEHCARRAAMSAATENADALIAELTIEYNRARQSAVTSQITEIIGSTQALNSGDRK